MVCLTNFINFTFFVICVLQQCTQIQYIKTHPSSVEKAKEEEELTIMMSNNW